MKALDYFNDNLCLWRCIAVFRGARVDRSTQAARELLKSFYKLDYSPNYFPKTSINELDKIERHFNQGKPLSDWFGIRVFEPKREGTGEVIWHLTRNPSGVLKDVLTIGIYEGHTFFIKDITKLTKTYVYIHCRARFTQPCNFERHSKTCAQGKTTIECPNERVEALQTAYEKALYPQNTASKESIRLLEQESKNRKNSHSSPVDGCDSKTRTVYQYHGFYWYSCPRCYNDRDRIIVHSGQTREQRYQETLGRTRALRMAGYSVVERWACQVRQVEATNCKRQTRSYPHAIIL